MYSNGRIKTSKWVGVILAVILLSQCIAHWKAFFASAGFMSYFVLIATLTLFLLLMVGLMVVIYAEEKAKGKVQHPRPWFERMADRFFLIHSDSTRG
jgi:general stress protein CsbA